MERYSRALSKVNMAQLRKTQKDVFRNLRSIEMYHDDLKAFNDGKAAQQRSGIRATFKKNKK